MTGTTTLIGEKAGEFIDWLDEAKYFLPPKMRISEARALYERKLKEEEELKNEPPTKEKF